MHTFSSSPGNLTRKKARVEGGMVFTMASVVVSITPVMREKRGWTSLVWRPTIMYVRSNIGGVNSWPR